MPPPFPWRWRLEANGQTPGDEVLSEVLEAQKGEVPSLASPRLSATRSATVCTVPWSSRTSPAQGWSMRNVATRQRCEALNQMLASARRPHLVRWSLTSFTLTPGEWTDWLAAPPKHIRNRGGAPCHQLRTCVASPPPWHSSAARRAPHHRRTLAQTLARRPVPRECILVR